MPEESCRTGIVAEAHAHRLERKKQIRKQNRGIKVEIHLMGPIVASHAASGILQDPRRRMRFFQLLIMGMIASRLAHETIPGGDPHFGGLLPFGINSFAA